MIESGHTEKPLLQATWMNWGMMCFASDELEERTWKVYRDGWVRTRPVFSASGAGPTVEYLMSPDDFRSLLSILTGAFLETEAFQDACDGEGWEMVSFDENGQETHRISGYIYGIQPLEEIADILLGERQP